MILADKIINERKKNGWSQEELAEQLSVSRQSVSKWESAQAVPDLQKIIMMADIFGVSTDYLLKEEIEPDTAVITHAVEEVKTVGDVRRVSMEEANEYMSLVKENAPKRANAVSLCVLSPVVLILLAGFSDSRLFGITETIGATVGLIVLLAMVAVAVYTFIIIESKFNKFKFLETCKIETAYGVDGLVRAKRDAFESYRTSRIACGVILCILCSLPLLISACLEMSDVVVVSMVAVLLIIVSVAVNMFVRVGQEWEGYNRLLEEGDFSYNNKVANIKTERISGIYWSIVLAGYLGWSFITMRWDYTWIVWPVSAILFGAISIIIRSFIKTE